MTGSNDVLMLGAANALALAIILWFVPGNRAASRMVSLILLVLTLRLGPHLLGLANIVDDPRRLLFVPLDFSYAFGPLLWMYVARLTNMALPANWRWHFVPLLFQVGYCGVCFMLPLETKWAWYSQVHLPRIAPVTGAFGLTSVAIYLWFSWQMTRRYRGWLDATYADRDEARLLGLRALLIAYAIAILAAAVSTVAMLSAPAHDFDARFPLMAVIAGLTYALGLLGWRNATVGFPPYCASVENRPAIEAATPRDSYRLQAEAWQTRVRASDWWRDETLDLAGLAALLGTTPRTLSRVVGEGLGENFRSFIGRIRVDAVCAALESSGDSASILDIALASGFSSKASFNRVFLQHRGTTPTAYRLMQGAKRLKSRQSDPAEDFGATGEFH